MAVELSFVLSCADRLIEMDEEAKNPDDRRSRLLEEIQRKAKDDPELAAQLEAAMYVMEKYKDTLQRLADS